jgi:hypothetical protein
MTRARPVAINLTDRPDWMRGIVLALPGLIVEDEGSGERIRVQDDGRLERLLPGGHPRPGAAHATATRRS